MILTRILYVLFGIGSNCVLSKVCCVLKNHILCITKLLVKPKGRNLFLPLLKLLQYIYVIWIWKTFRLFVCKRVSSCESASPGVLNPIQRIDSKESISPAYVACRAGTTTLFLLTCFLAPIDCLKIPALVFCENSRAVFPLNTEKLLCQCV